MRCLATPHCCFLLSELGEVTWLQVFLFLFSPQFIFSYVPRYTVCDIKLFFCDFITGIRNSHLPVWYQQIMWENSTRCVEKCYENLTVALRRLCWNQISVHMMSGCAFPWLITPGGMSLNPPTTGHYHTVAPCQWLTAASTGTNCVLQQLVFFNTMLTMLFYFGHFKIKWSNITRYK